MADSQLLAPWEHEGKVPQVVEAGEFLYEGQNVQFEFLRTHELEERLVIRMETGQDDGSWTVLPSHMGFPIEHRAKQLAKAIKHGGYGRNFWFGADATLSKRFEH